MLCTNDRNFSAALGSLGSDSRFYVTDMESIDVNSHWSSNAGDRRRQWPRTCFKDFSKLEQALSLKDISDLLWVP